jgi:hypothetical protein
MAMRVLYSKLCEYYCQLSSGRHTLIGIFDNIRVDSFPCHHPPFFICVELELEPPDQGQCITLSLVIIDEDGKEILRGESPVEIDVPRSPEGLPVRVHFAVYASKGIVFEKPGQYRLDVLCRDEKIGEERLPVIQMVSHPQRE